MLSGLPLNSVDEWQRFDYRVVLRGDLGLRARFLTLKLTSDVAEHVHVPVPQDPALHHPAYPSRRRPLRVAFDAPAGADTVQVRSRVALEATRLDAGWFVCFAASASPYAYVDDRLHYVYEGAADIVDPVSIGIFPALQTAVPANSLVDMYPAPRGLLAATAGFGESDYREKDVVVRAFTVRNAPR